MAIVINGSGTVTGLAVGGLPDGTVDAGTLATNSVDSAELVDASIDNAHLADDAVGVAELSATGTASSSTFLRGDNAWAAAGGDNTPSFKAHNTSSQTIQNGTETILLFPTEEWDTDNAFASNKFTVPSGKDGVYIFNWHFILAGMDSGEYVNTKLRLNGSQHMHTYTLFYSANNDAGMGTTGTAILDLNAGDYLEVIVEHSEGGSQDTYSNTNYFSGYRLIGV